MGGTTPGSASSLCVPGPPASSWAACGYHRESGLGASVPAKPSHLCAPATSVSDLCRSLSGPAGGRFTALPSPGPSARLPVKEEASRHTGFRPGELACRPSGGHRAGSHCSLDSEFSRHRPFSQKAIRQGPVSCLPASRRPRDRVQPGQLAPHLLAPLSPGGPAPADPRSGNNGGQVTTSPRPPAGLCSLPSCCRLRKRPCPGTARPGLCFPGAPPWALSKPGPGGASVVAQGRHLPPVPRLGPLGPRGQTRGYVPTSPRKEAGALGKWASRVRAGGGVRSMYAEGCTWVHTLLGPPWGQPHVGTYVARVERSHLLCRVSEIPPAGRGTPCRPLPAPPPPRSHTHISTLSLPQTQDTSALCGKD